MKRKMFVMLVGMALTVGILSGCVEEEVESNNAPVASFTFSPGSVHVNETVKFASTSTDADGDNLTLTWDFGDGLDLSSEDNPTHSYTEENIYTITLTVSDETASNSTSQEINVGVSISSNMAPVANFTYEATNLAVNFTDASDDKDGNITVWEWNFGDGNTSNEQNLPYTYAKAGTYNVTLTVTDDDTNDPKTNEITKQVTVTASEE